MCNNIMYAHKLSWTRPKLTQIFFQTLRISMQTNTSNWRLKLTISTRIMNLYFSPKECLEMEQNKKWFLPHSDTLRATKHIERVPVSPRTTLTPSLYLRISQETPSTWCGLRVALSPSSSSHGGASHARASSSRTILATT